jgi:hypothetical protein
MSARPGAREPAAAPKTAWSATQPAAAPPSSQAEGHGSPAQLGSPASISSGGPSRAAMSSGASFLAQRRAEREARAALQAYGSAPVAGYGEARGEHPSGQAWGSRPESAVGGA